MKPEPSYSPPSENCQILSPRCELVSLWPPLARYVPTSTAAGCGRHRTRSSLRRYGSSAGISKPRQLGRAHKKSRTLRAAILQEQAMLSDVAEDNVGRHYFAALYHPGCLRTLPGGEEPFDCVVFLCDFNRGKSVCKKLSRELVEANVDWIQIAGRGAEKLHDEIDAASVAMGRQTAIGD